MTKEWITEQIGKLERELIEADLRVASASEALNKAGEEHRSAHEAAETLAGCIRGLKDELEFVTAGEEK
jgi:hypothetical protein